MFFHIPNLAGAARMTAVCPDPALDFDRDPGIDRGVIKTPAPGSVKSVLAVQVDIGEEFDPSLLESRF
jgi:hypothetical protein